VLVDVQRLKPHKRDRYMPRREAEAVTEAVTEVVTATAAA
jgi:hypothetical protein